MSNTSETISFEFDWSDTWILKRVVEGEIESAAYDALSSVPEIESDGAVEQIKGHHDDWRAWLGVRSQIAALTQSEGGTLELTPERFDSLAQSVFYEITGAGDTLAYLREDKWLDFDVDEQAAIISAADLLYRKLIDVRRKATTPRVAVTA